jgi:hypothetical protein
MECRRSNLDFGHSVDQRGKMDTNHELSHEYPQTYQLWEQYQLRNIQEMGVSYKKSMKFWDKLDATSCYYAVAALVSRDHPKAGNGQSDQLLKFQVTFLFVCWE